MNDIEKLEKIKTWLGTGSINIFGVQFSGKDTVGKQLAKMLDATFIASGDIVRASGDKLNNADYQDKGFLAKPSEYKELIRDYILHQLPPGPLILGTIGRHTGEETVVMEALQASGHPTKAVLFLTISEDEVFRRWQKSFEIGDRPGRVDESEASLRTRLAEFRAKTLPVIDYYRDQNLLIEINGQQPREAVMRDVLQKLYAIARGIS